MMEKETRHCEGPRRVQLDRIVIWRLFAYSIRKGRVCMPCKKESFIPGKEICVSKMRRGRYSLMATEAMAVLSEGDYAVG